MRRHFVRQALQSVDAFVAERTREAGREAHIARRFRELPLDLRADQDLPRRDQHWVWREDCSHLRLRLDCAGERTRGEGNIIQRRGTRAFDVRLAGHSVPNVAELVTRAQRQHWRKREGCQAPPALRHRLNSPPKL